MNYAMYSLLNELKRQSLCRDKQVACIITDKEDKILSVGINQVINCKRCGIGLATANCESIHAEIVAVKAVNDDIITKCHRAYVSLYPCPNCQRELDRYVEEIIVFNKKHKECVIDENKIKVVGDLAMDLVEVNGKQKQLAVISGELGELITVISDYFYRRHERIITPISLMSEIADTELMIQCLLNILTKDVDSALIDYNTLKQGKLRRVVDKLHSGAIKTGSPFDKSFQDKEMN